MPSTERRVRPAPRDRFAGTEHLFNLAAEAEKLHAERLIPRNGHRQITLFRADGVAIVLFDFEANGFLKDHRADGIVTVQVLSGEIVMTTAKDTYVMPAGSLLARAPNVEHDVRASSASRLLLTVRLDPAEDDRD
jgi:quercetin dioxygenase-like cupin family protein